MIDAILTNTLLPDMSREFHPHARRQAVGRGTYQ